MGPFDSREQILERVAAAVATRARAEHPGRLQTGDPHPGNLQAGHLHTPAHQDLRAAFSNRFASSGGETASPDPRLPVKEWLGKLLGDLDAGGRGVAVAPDMPGALRPALPEASPETAGVGLCLARTAVAETGSLILAPASRATQILPPVLVVWVPADRILGRLEDALVDLKDDLPAAVGLHSGPSKSADIGQTVVTGVHGPGRCVAVLE